MHLSHTISIARKDHKCGVSSLHNQTIYLLLNNAGGANSSIEPCDLLEYQTPPIIRFTASRPNTPILHDPSIPKPLLRPSILSHRPNIATLSRPQSPLCLISQNFARIKLQASGRLLIYILRDVATHRPSQKATEIPVHRAMSIHSQF